MSLPQTTPEPVIRVGIVEDSAILRRNIERWLSRTPGFKCVAGCESGEEAIMRIPGSGAEVVLMDIQMGGMSGVECAAKLKQLKPDLQILMLTVYEDTETIFKALRAGASGYLLKRTSLPEIVNAVREIRRGGAPMTSEIARKVIDAFHPPVPEKAELDLTTREREILEWLVEGFSNKEISTKLDISPWTVKIHLAHIFEKLHVRSRVEATAAYLQQRSAAGPRVRLPRNEPSR
jgi:DNA-binding NarL/FixJ family response regulator